MYVVVTMGSAAQSDIFLGGVAASGWYDWFDQTNLRAELLAPEEAMTVHLELT